MIKKHPVIYTYKFWSNLQPVKIIKFSTVRHFTYILTLNLCFNWQVVDTVYGELGKHDKVWIGGKFLYHFIFSFFTFFSKPLSTVLVFCTTFYTLFPLQLISLLHFRCVPSRATRCWSTLDFLFLPALKSRRDM